MFLHQVYELMDETMDFGYPQTCESKILKECVTPLLRSSVRLTLFLSIVAQSDHSRGEPTRGRCPSTLRRPHQSGMKGWCTCMNIHLSFQICPWTPCSTPNENHVFKRPCVHAWIYIGIVATRRYQTSKKWNLSGCGWKTQFIGVEQWHSSTQWDHRCCADEIFFVWHAWVETRS